MEIVPIEDIPKDVVDVPTSNLMTVYKTCLEMEQVCRKNQGIGLSAVQVGIPWKLFVVDRGTFPTSKFEYYLDCSYEPIDNRVQHTIEGCLSLRNEKGSRQFQVERYVEVRVTGKQLIADDNLEVKEVDMTLKDVPSIVFQHEIDHQNQILISSGTEMEIW
jgi:peptide deformylase